MISNSYLTGVTAAELRRHLANMNMIESILPILLLNQNFPQRKKITNGALVTPTPGRPIRPLSECGPLVSTLMVLMYPLKMFPKIQRLVKCHVCSCTWWNKDVKNNNNNKIKIRVLGHVIQHWYTPVVCCNNVLQWHYNGRDGVSNHWLLDCLLNRLFRRWSK